MSARRALDAAEVALKLGHSLRWFYRHRKALEDSHGFPKPVPGLAKRWDERAIDAWLDRQSGLGEPALALAGAPVELRLERRARALAGAPLRSASAKRGRGAAAE